MHHCCLLYLLQISVSIQLPKFNNSWSSTVIHVTQWMKRWHVGTGFHNEQGGESLHNKFNQLQRQWVEWDSAWRGAVRGVGQCVEWGSARRGAVQSVGQCMEWGSVWSGACRNRLPQWTGGESLHNKFNQLQRQWVEWDSAWCGAVRGVGQCMEWGSARRGAMQGVGQCVEWGSAWSEAVRGVRQCVKWRSLNSHYLTSCSSAASFCHSTGNVSLLGTMVYWQHGW